MPTTEDQQPRLVALRHRDFRLLWLGQLISTIGSQMQLIAVNWHVYALLRGSSFSITLLGHEIDLGAEALGLGTLGLVRVVPIVIFALFGGMLADTQDRRRLLIWTQIFAATFAAALAATTLTDRDTIPLIYLLTAAGAGVAAFDNPARQSLVPNLVPPEHLTNAVSLNTLVWQLGTIIGPAVAGVLVGVYSPGVVYAVNAASYTAVLLALVFMHYRGGAAARGTGLGWGAVHL
jgi:MFS family permease